MTFELVRWGCPNTAAIVALAIMPIVALTTVPARPPELQPDVAAAICLSAAECAVTTAAAAPAITLE